MIIMKLFALLLVLGIGTALTIGSAYAATTVFDGDVEIPSGNSYKLGDFAISMSRTDPSGTGPGNDLNLRGFGGISFRTAGTADFGTGTEIMRVGAGGVEKLQMATGEAIDFVDPGISISRTDSSGTTVGNYLNLRGFDGIVMRTGGAPVAGSGDEQFRMGMSGVESINIAPGGNITSSGDICIGNC